MTLGSLFDGAGGFPLAGEMAGFTPLWASEIEPFPIMVSTMRYGCGGECRSLQERESRAPRDRFWRRGSSITFCAEFTVFTAISK